MLKERVRRYNPCVPPPPFIPPDHPSAPTRTPIVRLPSLDLIKGFVAVGRRMSLTQAADDLCLTQSAISKQIRALEDVLGVQLFVRSFRSVAFTDQGALLFRSADAALRQLQDVVGLLSGARGKPVTVTTTTSVAALWMLPQLGDFLAQHPDVDVRFAATNAVVELGDEVELALRYCPEKSAPQGAIRLFGDTVAPVAAPSLAVGALDAAQALGEVTLLEFDYPGHPWLHWSAWLGARGWSTAGVKAIVHFNHYEQMIQAALAGQGLALGRLELLHRPLHAGQLRVVPSGPAGVADSGYAYWLIQAKADARPQVRHVADWILAMARQINASLALPGGSHALASGPPSQSFM